MKPIHLATVYGLSADGADKRELTDNHRDEEIGEVQRSDRMEGRGGGIRDGGVHFDLLEHRTIMTFQERSIKPNFATPRCFTGRKRHFPFDQRRFA